MKIFIQELTEKLIKLKDKEFVDKVKVIDFMNYLSDCYDNELLKDDIKRKMEIGNYQILKEIPRILKEKGGSASSTCVSEGFHIYSAIMDEDRFFKFNKALINMEK